MLPPSKAFTKKNMRFVCASLPFNVGCCGSSIKYRKSKWSDQPEIGCSRLRFINATLVLLFFRLCHTPLPPGGAETSIKGGNSKWSDRLETGAISFTFHKCQSEYVFFCLGQSPSLRANCDTYQKSDPNTQIYIYIYIRIAR